MWFYERINQLEVYTWRRMRAINTNIKKILSNVENQTKSLISNPSLRIDILRKKLSSSSSDADAPWLERAEKTLTELASTVLQSSPKDISLLKDAIIAKGAGASGAAGILG
ncbi:MAG: hypothetical protein HOF30_19060, partial [Rhodospirillaceae bacterium]|nr:hypothetical protein [Rhodospirillaceae bacterium]